jgi:hypothetical protein
MNGNDYHKWLTVREGQAEKDDVSRNASRSRQPTMPRTAVRVKSGTRHDLRAQLPATRGTDWNATRSSVEYLSRTRLLTYYSKRRRQQHFTASHGSGSATRSTRSRRRLCYGRRDLHRQAFWSAYQRRLLPTARSQRKPDLMSLLSADHAID